MREPTRSVVAGLGVMDLTWASGNQIDDLLRRLEALRSAAGSA